MEFTQRCFSNKLISSAEKEKLFKLWRWECSLHLCHYFFDLVLCKLRSLFFFLSLSLIGRDRNRTFICITSAKSFVTFASTSIFICWLFEIRTTDWSYLPVYKTHLTKENLNIWWCPLHGYHGYLGGHIQKLQMDLSIGMAWTPL